jgi:hypothetical protein
MDCAVFWKYRTSLGSTLHGKDHGSQTYPFSSATLTDERDILWIPGKFPPADCPVTPGARFKIMEQENPGNLPEFNRAKGIVIWPI